MNSGEWVGEGSASIDDLELEPDVSYLELVVGQEADCTRLDSFVTERARGLSRNHVQHLIESGHVLVDGVPRKRSFKLSHGELVTVQIPPPTVESLEPENIPLDIVYEDRDLIVLNKSAGMVVHPAPGNTRGTLVNALLHHAPEINVAGSNRPGIVHRLDKDTSGLMVVAKTDRAKEALLGQWQARTVRKEYVALVRGVVEPDEATIDAPVGRDPLDRKRMAILATGRAATTHFRVRERFPAASLLELELETGRTHQIRVHLNFIGHPIVGDAVYNRQTDKFGGKHSISSRQFLHATGLSFNLPSDKRMSFHTELPADLQVILRALRSGSLSGNTG
ncbi:MAG: RluA family pseudouridine synthase [Thermomicrobiales bacterium]